jgi:arginine utilization protein RocB
MLNSRNNVMEITKELVQIESIVNTEGETALARFLHKQICNLAYFKLHPSHVKLVPTADDERGRYNVMAFVKGAKGESQRTAIQSCLGNETLCRL